MTRAGKFHHVGGRQAAGFLRNRFGVDAAQSVLRFNASLPFDQRLAVQDIRGSLAHVAMLAARGIISGEEAARLQKGLQAVDKEIREERFPYDLRCEDIHMNIEKRLTEVAGPVGGKLHTGRSRNDQVALDMHLYLREEITAIDGLLLELQEVFLELAERWRGTIMPGYTHLQRAQPVQLSHHLLAYFWMLQRDRERLAGCYRRADLMPLGAGALAGTGYPIDREMVAERLGFSRLYENSMDAVSDRDYIVEFLSFAAILIMHVSRLCEEIILWCSPEFGFLELDDAYTTGSSIMPQKKNPDVAELARGKAGRIYGHLLALLTVLKGLPLAYNKDLQEDKEGLFDTVDTLKALLPLLREMLLTARFNRERMAQAAGESFTCATVLADYLVGQGLSFREAHRAVSGLAGYCARQGKTPAALTPQERAAFHPALAGDITPLLDPAAAVEACNSRGGTSTAALEEQLARARRALAAENF